MLQMQVFEYKNYLKKSENNSFRIQVTMPKRGNILSENGSVISRDAPIYRIYLIPEETDDLENVINTVSDELKLRKKTVDRIWKNVKKQAKFQPVLISENSNWDTLAKLSAKNIPGIHIDNGFSRNYEMGPAGAQVFGYVGAPKKPVLNTPFFTTGINGLEKRFNDDMSGKPGKTVHITNALGRVTGEDKTQFISPIPGKDIKTTIKENIQKTLYDSLALNRAGCGVVLDIESGGILAMASTPSFDPNNFKTDDGEEYISSLLEDAAKPFMNKTIEGLYPPGSTFKIVVALAALESGAISPNEKVFCPGFWEYGNHRYHCWEKHGHGSVDLYGALKHSCDTYFYQVALRIGIDAIKNMALKLGLNQKYMDDVLAHEMPGIIPDRHWKEKNVGAPWVHGDTIISGIGQGFILTNCLQLAVMMARVASNKEIYPHLIWSDKKPDFKNLGLQTKNIKHVLTGLEQVTQKGGTASGSAINVNGKKMGGKTGTSQVRNISKKERETGVLTNEQLKWNLRNHGLFVGYAPTDKPKYAVCVIMEHAGGSSPAAHATANIMKELLK
jgi:penicillin-binding protein 2